MTDQEDRGRESRESPITTQPDRLTDEEQIRGVVANWHRASGDGDLESVLALMAEDVVFLTPWGPPMRGREAFAEGFRNVVAKSRIESTGEIEEIRVVGDLAYCWTQLSVTTVPHDAGEPQQRTGPTLTIFTRQPDGRWVLSRDANLLPPPA
jgi:uncharacterized protein (TIGR02246 family)